MDKANDHLIRPMTEGTLLEITHSSKNAGSHRSGVMHLHGYYELYYLISGEVEYFILNRSHRLFEGDVVLIKPYESHTTVYSFESSMERITVKFDPKFLEGFQEHLREANADNLLKSDINVFRLSPDVRKKLSDTLDEMNREYLSQTRGAQTIIRLLLTKALIHLNGAFEAGNREIEAGRGSVRSKVNGIADYIYSHYDEDLSLAGLAGAFNISPFYLVRIFKRHTAFTPAEYINHVRIMEAVKLLRATNDSIADIAVNTGFNSMTHFGRVFKRLIGASPLKFRQNHKMTGQYN
ncbi:MAG: AraC family transcriptional regulator [bacterium]|nr:AraC family transcriptional regulator [bacterium]